MVEHVCEKCNKSFNKKSTYINHLKRKTSCVAYEIKELNELKVLVNELKLQINQLIK